MSALLITAQQRALAMTPPLELKLKFTRPASASTFQLHVREGEFLAQLMSRKGAPRGALFTSMCGG